MKKYIIPILAILAVLFFTVCFFWLFFGLVGWHTLWVTPLAMLISFAGVYVFE